MLILVLAHGTIYNVCAMYLMTPETISSHNHFLWKIHYLSVYFSVFDNAGKYVGCESPFYKYKYTKITQETYALICFH